MVFAEELTLSNPTTSLGILLTMAQSLILARALVGANLPRRLRNPQQYQVFEIEGSHRWPRFRRPLPRGRGAKGSQSAGSKPKPRMPAMRCAKKRTRPR